MMYPYYMSGWGGAGDLFSFLIWLVVLAFVIRIIVRIFLGRRWHRCGRCDGYGTPSTESEKSPLDIVKERYAKGEITKKEYEEKKKEFSA